MGDKTRIHIKHQEGGYEYNVFADSAEEGVQLMSQLLIAAGEYQTQSSVILDQVRQIAAVAASVPQQPVPQAAPPVQAARQPAQQQPGQTQRQPQQARYVPCPHCGQEAQLKQWTDKVDGRSIGRYKCADCNTWVGPAL